MKKIILLLLICLTANSVNSQVDYSKELIDRGLWLRSDATGEDIDISKKMNFAIDFIKAENDANVYTNPWVGVNLQLVWGQLYNGSNYDQGIESIIEALDLAEKRQLFVQLAISDKYQSNINNCGCNSTNSNCDDDYYLGSTPTINNIVLGPLEHEDFDTFKVQNNTTPSNPIICNTSGNEYYEAFHISDYRYARQQYVEKKDQKEDRFVRKYFSSRWNSDVKREWRIFLKELGEKIGDHPALHSIITPESSNSFDNVKNEILDPNTNVINPNNLFNYAGGKQYVSYLAYNSVKLREYFPDNVLIINNTNWVFPNKKPDGTYYQKDIADKYLNQNLTLKNNNKTATIGWCSQDIVLSKSRVNAYNTRGVYDQMKRFPKKLRFGLVTGETKDTDVDPSEIPESILKKTDTLGLSHLIFISIGNTNGYTNLIRAAKPGDYPFMPDATCNDGIQNQDETGIDSGGICNTLNENNSYFITNRATGYRLKLNDNQPDLTITDSNDSSAGAKWKIIYENREGFNSNSFQLFNQKNGEIIRYSGSSGVLFGKVVKDNNTSIKWKSTFWKIRPAIKNGFFYLENLKSEKHLKHNDTDDRLHQAVGIGGKSEWAFEIAPTSLKLVSNDKTKNSINNSNKLLVYPNPASYTIQLNKKIESPIYIYSIQGQLIKKYKKKSKIIDVSSLRNGVYFIKMNSNVSRFIKQ